MFADSLSLTLLLTLTTLADKAYGLRIDKGIFSRAPSARVAGGVQLCAYVAGINAPGVSEAITAAGPENKLAKSIFCNRALNMDQIQAVGFDLDYTLAEYKPAFDLLAYNGAIDKLLTMGYPEEIKAFEYRPDDYQRGLVIDKRRGNVIKLDRHKYPKVVYHGLKKLPPAERKGLYSRSFEAQPNFAPPDYVSVDTEFQLVDVSLFCQLVDLKDRKPDQVHHSYAEIYKQVRKH